MKKEGRVHPTDKHSSFLAGTDPGVLCGMNDMIRQTLLIDGDNVDEPCNPFGIDMI